MKRGLVRAAISRARFVARHSFAGMNSGPLRGHKNAEDHHTSKYEGRERPAPGKPTMIYWLVKEVA